MIAVNRFQLVHVMFAGLTVLSIPGLVRGQSFFGGGAVAYDPEVSTVQSGAILDAQVVVSYDRKYVTIGAQATDTRLLALRDFPVVSPVTQGFVGGVTPVTGNTGGGFSASDPGARRANNNRGRRDANEPLPMPSASPADIERRAIGARSVLSQQGMFLLHAL